MFSAQIIVLLAKLLGLRERIVPAEPRHSFGPTRKDYEELEKLPGWAKFEAEIDEYRNSITYSPECFPPSIAEAVSQLEGPPAELAPEWLLDAVAHLSTCEGCRTMVAIYNPKSPLLPPTG